MPVPTAPIIGVRPSVTATTLQFWWSPPAQTNGIITGYLLECTASSISNNYAATARTVIVTDLTPDTDYTFTIKATNASGNSPSAVFHTVHTSDIPQPVSTLTVAESVTGGILTLVFSWTNPADYAYFYAYGLRQATGTKDFIYTGTSDYSTLSYTATGLNPYQTYTFHIQRGNDAAYSTTTSLTTTAQFLNPTTIPGLWLWLDATDVSGNGAVVADGSKVRTWKDKSGTTNNATAPTTTPIIGTDSMGRYLEFDGSGNYYKTLYTKPADSYYTIFIVDSLTTKINELRALIDCSGSAESPAIAYGAGNSIYYAIKAVSSYIDCSFNAVNVWCLTNYALQNVYLNKQIVYTEEYNGPFSAASKISIGGSELGSIFYLNYIGKIREVLIYFGAMRETDRAAISDYLCAKWALQPPATTLPVQRGLTQWLDAADITTMYQDISGSKNIYGQGYMTKFWKDKSGNGNNMQFVYNQDYVMYPAVYNAGIMNGLPGLDFSQGNGSLFASNAIRLNTETTLFMVVLMTTVAGRDNVSNVWSHGVNNIDPVIGLTNGTHQIFYSVNNDIYSTRTPFVVNRPGLYVATMTNDQITSFKTFDTSGNMIYDAIKARPAYAEGKSGGAVNGTFPISLGGWIFSQLASKQSGCVFSEVIYYQRMLSPEEITTTANYLTKKWGIYIPPVPVVPTDLPGLQLWLDAKDPTMTQHSGTTLTGWYDKSGRQNHPTGVGNPEYSATTDISGVSLPIEGITLNGTSQWFTLPNRTLPSGNSPFSYYIVATSTDVSGYNYGVISGGTNADQFSMNVVGANTMAITNDYRNFQTPDGTNLRPASKNSMFASNGGILQSAWNGSYWLGLGESVNYTGTNVIVKSFDGINWFDTMPKLPMNVISVNHIVWNGTVWIMCLNTNASNTIAVGVYSYNGATWINGVNLPTGASINTQGMATSGSLTILAGVAGGGSSAYYSTDGITWSVHTSMSSVMPNPMDIAFNGSTWIAGGYYGNSANPQALAYSTDGYTWLPSANGNSVFGNDVRAVAASSKMFVAGGDQNGTIYSIGYSSDGITWYGTTPATDVSYPIISLKWNGKVFLGSGVTGPNGQMYSPDGINWYQPNYNRVSGGMNIGTMFSGSYGVAKLYPSLQTTLGALTTRPVVAIAGSSYGTQGGIIYTYDGLTWYPSAANGINTAVYSTGYNGKMWIVAAAFQAGAYSYDGLNWLPIMDPYFTTTVPLAFAWTGSIWVCGLQNSLGSLWSADGLVWNIANGSGLNTGSQEGIATSGSLTVMCGSIYNGSATSAWTSTDGKNWIANASLCSILDFRGLCVAYNGSMWVAGGRGSNSLAWSSDGLNWNAANSSPFVGSDGCQAVAWNGSLWVAGGSTIYGSANSIVYSSDGKTWTASTSGSALFTSCFAVAWTGTYWIASGVGSVKLAYSTNGIDWSAVTSSPWKMNATPSCISSAYALPITTPPSPPAAPPLAPPSASTPSILAVKSYPISRTMNLLESFYSANSNTVTEYTNGQNVITQPGKVRYLMGGNTGGGEFPAALVYSYDGIIVNKGFQFPLYTCNGIAFNGSLWLAVGASGSDFISYATSTDGITWTPGERDVSGNPFYGSFATCVGWNGTYWLVGGHYNVGGINFMKSYDGYTWTPSPEVPFGGTPNSVNSVAWNGTYWVAVGTGYSYGVSIYKSTDGMTWTAATTDPFIGGSNSGNGVVWNGSIWVAVGQATNSLAISSNGLSWTNYSIPFVIGNGIAWNGSYFIAVGTNGDGSVGIARSSNGYSWTPIPLFGYTSIQCRSVCWDGLQWVVLGSNSTYGIVATSRDGVNWTVNNIGTGTAALCIATRVPLRNQDISGNLLGKALGQKMKGSIHEVLVYAAEHTASQRQFIENYLQNKWFYKNFTLTSIAAPMGLWLDANPVNFVYSSGTTIQKWIDKSDNHCDCSQNTVWAQPTYEFDSRTNRYGVRFGSNGVTNSLNSSVSPFSSTQTWSVVLVARFTQLVNLNNIFSVSDISQTFLGVGSGTTLNMSVGNQSSTATIPTNPINPFIYTSSVDSSGNWMNYYNGVPIKFGSSATHMSSNSYINLGWKNTTGNFMEPLLYNSNGFTGYIFEFFVFKSSLTSLNQQALEGYLAWKWGIQQYLGNTYSSAPP